VGGNVWMLVDVSDGYNLLSIVVFVGNPVL